QLCCPAQSADELLVSNSFRCVSLTVNATRSEFFARLRPTRPARSPFRPLGAV
ncbi:hypothetical protein J6590_029754, partial [Homalodisca vitripennis]